MNDNDWIVGRKAIMKALDKDCWRTIRRWKRKYGIKFIRFPNGQPAIQKSILDQWLMLYHNNKKS